MSLKTLILRVANNNAVEVFLEVMDYSARGSIARRNLEQKVWLILSNWEMCLMCTGILLVHIVERVCIAHLMIVIGN